MEYDKMLDELLAEYPAAKEEVEALKGALDAEMPDAELAPDDDAEMPELPPMPMLGADEDLDEEAMEEEDEDYEEE
jgi:hypothetical protein